MLWIDASKVIATTEWGSIRITLAETGTEKSKDNTILFSVEVKSNECYKAFTE